MRLWHYELIPYLPKSQLVAQWRELNSIFKNQPKHILINYVYEYNKHDIWSYANMVIDEMKKRSIEVKSVTNLVDYVKTIGLVNIKSVEHPFVRHHTHRYLMQCFYNLQEKYDRGQKDFTYEQYEALRQFINKHYVEDEV